jgi:pimeloyl-ACP methyl ester carboxylesterase
MAATPFHIDIPLTVVDDLKRRLLASRFPDQIGGSGWLQGTDTAYLKELVRYWAHDFDWGAQQARLNAYPHFHAEIDGQSIHFLRATSQRPGALPLLLLHGWPSSFVQFMDVIPLLTNPVPGGLAFDVVAASLPGYGFSGIPAKLGMSPSAIAPLMHKLMTEVLGFSRYGIRSSDLGAGVAGSMAANFPQSIIGSHTGGTNPWFQGPVPSDMTAEEKAFVSAAQAWMQQEMAYAQLHASKPQTLAAALNDSPAGLASWIVEKFHKWTDNRGRVEDAVSQDSFLANLTIYWATQTIGSSMRLYFEAVRDQGGWAQPKAPIGYLMPKHDMFPTPRSWIERQGPVFHWTESDKGGHFMEWEQPEIVAADLRLFFGKFAR